jgi:hypothetical protein
VILPRPNFRPYDLHPDGERLAVAIPSAQVKEKLDKVTFIFNFSDETLDARTLARCYLFSCIWPGARCGWVGAPQGFDPGTMFLLIRNT